MNLILQKILQKGKNDRELGKYLHILLQSLN